MSPSLFLPVSKGDSDAVDGIRLVWGLPYRPRRAQSLSTEQRSSRASLEPRGLCGCIVHHDKRHWIILRALIECVLRTCFPLIILRRLISGYQEHQ